MEEGTENKNNRQKQSRSHRKTHQSIESRNKRQELEYYKPGAFSSKQQKEGDKKRIVSKKSIDVVEEKDKQNTLETEIKIEPKKRNGGRKYRNNNNNNNTNSRESNKKPSKSRNGYENENGVKRSSEERKNRDWNRSEPSIKVTLPPRFKRPVLPDTSYVDDEELHFRVTDWSLEEERGGIIRIPSENWRGDNPAWRGVSSEPLRSAPPRVLYDPNNPNKPIPVGSKTESPRFNMDRFPNYRPPFPPTIHPVLLSRPNGPDWYNVYDQRIYSDNKHDINAITSIARSDITLYRITMCGGGILLCQLWKTDVTECRQNILNSFRQLLLTDLPFCAEYNIEFHIWKIGFYNLMEVLKLALPDVNSEEYRDMLKSRISQLLAEGLDFYSQMLKLLDKTYNLDLESYYDVLHPRPIDKMIRCALMSAQNCLLCLGDLARYQELTNESLNYGKARQYYQKANYLETKNGRPFNQLAILANTTKRKFEAVYYNMRCLMSKNPFPSSSQSLNIIFEEMKKRWEATEKIRLKDKKERSMDIEKGNCRFRKEIWIQPDGSLCQIKAQDDDEIELSQLSASDLNRQFINTFLHLIGKLYTNINMDNFSLVCETLYKEFRNLISRSPLPIYSKRLVQIMALNMFAIEHTKMKGGDSTNYRSAMQDSALRLSFDMFSILCERVNNLLFEFKAQNTNSLFSDNDDLSSLLPAIKVWCDWLIGNNETWFPIVSEEPFIQLANLATHLEKLRPILNKTLITFSNNSLEGFELIKLEEDAILCGFNPWFCGLDWSSYRRYCPSDIPSILAQEVRRLDAINFCVEFLEGLEPPILKWSSRKNAHVSVVNQSLSESSSFTPSVLYTEKTKELYTREHKSSLSEHSTSNDKIRELKSRRDELEKRRQEKDEEVSLILSERSSVTLEIRPRILVLDTNTFVDHMDQIHQLATRFTLRVPLVVVNELDGLAKGTSCNPTKYATVEHAHMVQENARSALAHLKEHRLPNTKCITAKGTVLSSFSITTEEGSDSTKKNDDLILDACLTLSGKEVSSVGGHTLIKQEVVLLTEDRNLRIKAHINDIPVIKIIDFVRWLGTSK